MTLVGTRPEVGEPSAPRRFVRRLSAAVLIWSGLIAIAGLWGGILLWRGAYFSSIGAPPLWGHFGLILSPGILIALSVSAAVLVLTPRLSATLRWRWAMIVIPLIAFVWAFSLTFAAGSRELIRPVLAPNEYLHDLSRVGDPITFLHQFVARIGTYATHVRAHPPGMLMFLWLLDRVGLRGAWPAALAMIAGGAAAVFAAMVAIRELAGEQAARAAAPFLATAPAAIWIATSADAFFTGVSAWAVALIVLATGRRDKRGATYAFCGGVLFGVALMLSYGLVALAAVPVIVAVARRRAQPLILAVLGVAAVLVTFRAMGFSWIAGFFATRHQYEIFRTRFRPYGYFLFANLAAFAVAMGPVIVRGLMRLRDRG